ncbi:MAG: hypothetical protein EP329_25765 [Deltaproteobacteria bacterium]|nr:MAG: hypothetical protein EP329_25765 [Deltaproteobacteria bacterium]
MTTRHKVFISYHHALDQQYKNDLVRYYADRVDGFVDRSVGIGDIDDSVSTERIAQLIREKHLRDSTVTVVLIGAGTWRRKHVDWEIYSSLRATSASPRSGLLGILLPTYQIPWGATGTQQWTQPATAYYWPNNIPPRLWDNVATGFAKVRPWPSSGQQLQEWIHEAYLRRDANPAPTLARDRFRNNRPDVQSGWQ